MSGLLWLVAVAVAAFAGGLGGCIVGSYAVRVTVTEMLLRERRHDG